MISAEKREVLMALRVCPVCGFSEQRDHQMSAGLPVQTYHGFQFFMDYQAPAVTLRDVQCRRCWGIYRNPTFTDEGMRVLFAHAAASYGSAHPQERAEEQVAFLFARGLTDDVVDYGCGDGRFISLVPAKRRCGIDIEVRQLREQLSPTIAWQTPDQALPFEPRTITMWHCLEHLADPAAVLLKLRAPGRRLVVEVPILENARIGDLGGFFTPQHVTHFTARSLIALLLRGGWAVTEAVDMPDYNGLRVVATPIEVPQHLAQARADEDRDVASTYLNLHQAACEDVAQRLVAGVWANPFVLWGAGFHTELLFHRTRLVEHMPRLVVDQDKGKHGMTWRGVSITSPMALRQVDWATHKLVVSSYSSQEAIVAAARALDVPAEAIVTLYDKVECY